jgi:major inositol transporter-like SP family MFS transporter
MALMGVVGWIVNYLLTLTFPLLLAAIAVGGVFALYAIINCLGLWILAKKIPETKQKSLEEIDRIFQEGIKK